MSKLLFFCISSALLLFSVIVVNILPPIPSYWYDESCSSIADDLKYYEAKSLKDLGNISQDEKNEMIDIYKRNKNICNRRKAMVALQSTASNLNIIFGFICAFLGFLIYFDIKNIEITGLIGLGCGVIGFVLTLVYVIESGLVFNDIDDQYDIRIDSDGAALELDGNEYKCIFYDKDDKFALFTRFSDYGNKFLNYKKEVIHRNDDKNYEYKGCTFSISNYASSLGFGSSSSYNLDKLISCNTVCKNINDKKISIQKQEYRDDKGTKVGDCSKLYDFSFSTSYEKKNLYDRWLTTIILSCFILLLNIGLAIFGFLLFNSSGKTNL